MTGREPPAEASDHRRRAAGDAVSCLACGTVYSKPFRTVGGVGSACPACGYAGWLATAVIGSHDPTRGGTTARPAV